MLARILDTKIKRFGLVLIILSLVPIAYTVAHYHFDTGFVAERTAYQYRAAKKPPLKANEVVLKAGKQGWAVLSRECYQSRLKAWQAKNGKKSMPLPRDCATSYKLRQTVATKVREFQTAPYFSRLLNTNGGYFTFLAIAVFVLLTGIIMVIGLFDRVGRWVFWGE
jgi:hypothetical protein